MILDAVEQLRAKFQLPVDVERRGPVLLEPFFEELDVGHTELPNLTLGLVIQDLRRLGAKLADPDTPEMPLAGLLYSVPGTRMVYINASHILVRQRFTAAHELGHVVLHPDKDQAFLMDSTVSEGEEATVKMEREANEFAAELLMPRELIEARAEELLHTHGACPRTVLAYRLASELLVSREAMRYRLKGLGVGDE